MSAGWPPRDAAQRTIGDGEVVADNIGLGDPVVGKVLLSRLEIATSCPEISMISFGSGMTSR